MGLEVCVLPVESPDGGGVVFAPSVLPSVGPTPCCCARIHGAELSHDRHSCLGNGLMGHSRTLSRTPEPPTLGTSLMASDSFATITAGRYLRTRGADDLAYAQAVAEVVVFHHTLGLTGPVRRSPVSCTPQATPCIRPTFT